MKRITLFTALIFLASSGLMAQMSNGGIQYLVKSDGKTIIRNLPFSKTFADTTAPIGQCADMVCHQHGHDLVRVDVG